MKELSYGTLGPSLHHFGKLRGNTPANQKYAYDKICNSKALTPRTNVPRFGHNGVPSPDQIADLVGLLMDPDSPVNQ